MSPIKREFILYLEDMFQSILRIEEYFGIDYEMLWEIAKNNLPQNQIDLQKIIEKEKLQRGNNK